MPLNSSTLFTGELVRLAAPTPEDDPILARWSANAEYMRLLDSDPARPHSARYFTDRKPDDQSYEFRVRTLSEDRLIGFTELEPDWSNQVAWLGIGIGEPEYWDKGYGSDALRLTVGYAFRELNMYKVCLNVHEFNPRALHVYQKAGFVHEGTLRAMVYKDGVRYSVHNMGLLRPEWEARQATPPT